MKNGTFRVIVILVGLLFINIEAANAGLIQKLRLYIRHEFTDFQLVYFTAVFLIMLFLSYVLFTPVSIGREKKTWLNYYSYNPSRQDYQARRDVVKKISTILKTKEAVDQART
jgi:hypothetical protein